jgi:signal transduction histidine kinase
MGIRDAVARAGTVRIRTAVAAALVVGLTLAVSAVVVSLLMRRSLVRNLQDATELRSADVASLARADDLPPVIPQVGEDQALVQVFDGAGRLLASSAELRDGALMPQFLGHGETLLTRIVENPAFEPDETFLVSARRFQSPTGPAVIYAAASLDNVDDTVAAVNGLLAVGVPLLLAAVGFTSWLVTGRALRPVDSIRAEVAEITTQDLSRRVPEPAATDEIGRLARTMNDMLDRLQAGSDRQRRFVADASHEMQSPLASARAQLEVGLASGEGTDWPATAAGVLSEHDRMERLVQDLLFVASADEGTGPPKRQRVDLDDLVLEEAHSLRSKGRVEVDLSRVSGGQVLGDRHQLGRVVRNLLDNAERHARSRIAVELAADGDAVQLVVADDGDGIRPEDRARIFERFARLDKGRARSEGGTGLGLAIAKAVVEAHGGTIAVLDGAGGRFAVRLPRPEPA